jgi:adenylosuccinate synthase
MGVGETRRYWLQHGHDALIARDLGWEVLTVDKLELLRQRMLAEFPHSVEIRDFSPDAWIDCLPELNLVESPRPSGDDVVFEGAQGMLIDERCGSHPHTTWSDVTARNALELCAAFDWKIEQVVGCTRAYMTRHGYGPLPNEEMHSLKDEGNPDNEWQKQIRFAPLDLPLLRHAVANVGCELSGLSVSCLDQFREFNVVCLSRGELWGTSVNSTKVRCDHPEEALAYLRELAPVKITANGPTWEHRAEAAA